MKNIILFLGALCFAVPAQAMQPQEQPYQRYLAIIKARQKVVDALPQADSDDHLSLERRNYFANIDMHFFMCCKGKALSKLTEYRFARMIKQTQVLVDFEEAVNKEKQKSIAQAQQYLDRQRQEANALLRNSSNS